MSDDGGSRRAARSGPARRIDLDVEPASVRRARRFVLDFARELHLDGLSQDLALVTSELVSNAVRHARRSVSVEVTAGAGEVRVAVADDGTGAPVLGRPDPRRPTGRGLVIVDGVASQWGTSASAGRKTVWAVLVEP